MAHHFFFILSGKAKNYIKRLGLLLFVVGVLALLFEDPIYAITVAVMGVVIALIGHTLPGKSYSALSPTMSCPNCGIPYPIFYYTSKDFICPHCGYEMKPT